MTDDSVKPNWLLWGLICLSVGFHLFIFMHVTKIYRPRPMTFIELALQTIPRPPEREIPSPSVRERMEAGFHEKIIIEAIEPVVLPAPPQKKAAPESVAVQDPPKKDVMPDIPVVGEADINEQPDEGSTVHASAPREIRDPEQPEKTYIEMVRERIEAVQKKEKYPRKALKRNIQGVVRIAFQIGEDGGILSKKIIKSSGSRILDRAAMNTIEKASPFGTPPTWPIAIQIPISYKLI